MADQYVNEGAAFTSTSGQVVMTGDVYSPTQNDLERRHYKLKRIIKRTPMAVPPVSEMPGSPFAGWASDEAEELAMDNGLRRTDFMGQSGSGKDGRFTKSDIQKKLEAMGVE